MSRSIAIDLGAESGRVIVATLDRDLHVVGGGTRNRLLCKLTADALGDLGSLHDERQVIRRSFEVEVYQSGDAGPWDEAYEKFLDATRSAGTPR